ncbi:hypothetical protein [Actinophytocola algeriensis]|uniref:Uncharacterized protein n=1 Tax=Actinophytocola algeriensis TaxID=1768010 RepID=A0A7W7Q402_9PSEU|nr:hypothetical protein [Actinophytocola algeriensis]MBB4906423.1 hypothetical protein [Actinophytocola algeriensis]MBE1477904.1 hypothetical protein [Actinophytocola algeriensis]
MYQHMHMDPLAAQAAVDRSNSNLAEQTGNQATNLANHEGTRAGFYGNAARAYETSFVANDEVQTATGRTHDHINTANQFTVNEYQVADDDNMALFNMQVNPTA